MLSRTASHLYWMARYIERAENTARMLDAANQHALLPAARADEARNWTGPLLITGREQIYLDSGRPVTAADVTAYMALDADNPCSIVACLAAARENARAVRSTITSEMWEVVNTTWLGLREFDAKVLRFRGTASFLDWVKERSHLFRGVTFGTMLHDEAFRFNRLGTFIERADNTSRILDIHYNSLVTQVGGRAADYYQWAALLRSVSALEAYRKVFRHQVSASHVAQLLLLDPHLPRSLRYCVSEVLATLQVVLGQASSLSMRTAMGLYAELDNATVEDLMASDDSLDVQRLLGRILLLAEQIERELFALRDAGTPSPVLPLRGVA